MEKKNTLALALAAYSAVRCSRLVTANVLQDPPLLIGGCTGPQQRRISATLTVRPTCPAPTHPAPTCPAPTHPAMADVATSGGFGFRDRHLFAHPVVAILPLTPSTTSSIHCHHSHHLSSNLCLFYFTPVTLPAWGLCHFTPFTSIYLHLPPFTSIYLDGCASKRAGCLASNGTCMNPPASTATQHPTATQPHSHTTPHCSIRSQP